MSKTVSFKNHDRFVQIGIAIVALRKLCGMSQEKLAEKAGISRSLLSVIEAPGTAHNFTLDVFFDIADALNVDPADLISASMIPEKMLKGRNSKEYPATRHRIPIAGASCKDAPASYVLCFKSKHVLIVYC